MISSPSAQIVNAIAESTTVTASSGKLAPAYGPTMGVATAIIAVGIAITTAFGPEKRGRRFESAVTGVDESVLRKDIDLEEGIEHKDTDKETEERIERAEKV